MMPFLFVISFIFSVLAVELSVTAFPLTLY